MNVLVTIMFIQALIAFFMGFGIGTTIGPNARWILGVLIALILWRLRGVLHASRGRL